MKLSYIATFSVRFAGLPPSRATSLLRSCNQSCTDSGLHAHFSRSLPLYICGCAFRKGIAEDPFVQNVGDYMLVCMGCGDTCAPVSSAPLRGPAKLSRVPPPSRAHPRHSGRCLVRRAAGSVSGSGSRGWILFVSPPHQTGHSARTRAELKSLIDEIIMRPWGPFNPLEG